MIDCSIHGNKKKRGNKHLNNLNQLARRSRKAEVKKEKSVQVQRWDINEGCR
jgi:hypothetical protein